MREAAAAAARRVTVLSVGGLCAVVALVGAVGVVAGLAGSWRWLFRFERVAAASVPVVLALLAVSLAAAVGVLALTPATAE